MNEYVKQGIFKILSFAWQNRRTMDRVIHNWVHHKILFDDLVDMGEENPRHPMNQKKEGE